MFNSSDFEIFQDKTLNGRMSKVRQQLDPKFELIADQLLPIFKENGLLVYSHVAKHARRTVNPPVNTWVAFGPNKRGYKKDPHIELGFWDDRLFIWLCLLEQSKQFPIMKERLRLIEPQVAKLKADVVLSNDHMDKIILSNQPEQFEQVISEYSTKRTKEVLVGNVWLKGDPFFKLDDQEQTAEIIRQFRMLLPLYQQLNSTK